MDSGYRGNTARVAQMTLWDDVELPGTPNRGEPVELLPLDSYSLIIVGVSGGKDSTACVLRLLDLGVDPSKIELWHQRTDGSPADPNYDPLMDWPVTEPYIQALGNYLGIPVLWQWRSGGISAELMRTNERTHGVYYTDANGKITYLPTTKGKYSTRRRWPGLSANLAVRWCSGAAKVDPFRRVINNDPRLKGTPRDPKKILVVTGERREESSNRAKYLEAEVHPCNTQSRIVHWWRPVINFSEADVWQLYAKYHIRPHPVYNLGFHRVSCAACVFLNPDGWAMLRHIWPERFKQVAEKETELNHTIDPKMDVVTKANKGCLDRMPQDPRQSHWIQQALSDAYRKEDIYTKDWELPAGAFQRGSGGGPS